MCLVPRSEILTAYKNLFVYKVLAVDKTSLRSPYYNCNWTINKIKTQVHFTQTDMGWIAGGFHAFTSIERAKAEQTILKHICSTKSYVIYKAIIPKNVNYILGTIDDIVSLALIIKEEVCH